jgi:hypothetical protein
MALHMCVVDFGDLVMKDFFRHNEAIRILRTGLVLPERWETQWRGKRILSGPTNQKPPQDRYAGYEFST